MANAMTSLRSAISRIWTGSRSLILRLVLPLMLLSVILVGLARPVSVDDLALNLATDLITIVITVLYVDWAVRQHDKESWRTAEKYIASEAASVANTFIRDVAEALRIEDQIFPRPVPRDVREIQETILANVASLDRLAVEDALAKLTAPRWKGLISIIEARRADSTPVISQFAARLSADQLSGILAFRRVCSSILGTYSLFDDFLGVPVTNLQKVAGGKPEEYTVITIIQIGIDLKAALDASLAIVRAFDYVIEPVPDNTEEMQVSWARWYERTSRSKR